MNLPAEGEICDKLLAFAALLRKWNRVYNLTSIENPEDMVRLHLLDSLALLPYLAGTRILDVGAGAGLPGIPLAACAPEREFVLLDANAKKTRFMLQAAIELGLSNVRVEHARIERYRPERGFDSIMARAYARLSLLVEQTARLLAPGGVILAQKGKLPAEEIRALENASVEIVPLAVHGIEAARHLIAIKIQG